MEALSIGCRNKHWWQSFNKILISSPSLITTGLAIVAQAALDSWAASLHAPQRPGLFTPHCNDDLNIINEQGNPMVNLSNLVFWQCKIAIFEIRSPALLEIPVCMHSPFCPIWRIFLPVYNRPSKRAGDLILKMAILHCQSTKLFDLTIGILCSFIMLRSSLHWWVIHLYVLCTMYVFYTTLLVWFAKSKCRRRRTRMREI